MKAWLKQAMTLIPQRLRFWLPLKRRSHKVQKEVVREQRLRIPKLSLLAQLRAELNAVEVEVLKL
jgi:hypothetical protein